MSHLVTGSDDGYLRDYDIFPGLNGKNFLSAPQRHHTGVVEGLMKAATVRYWWENPGKKLSTVAEEAIGESMNSPVYSLALHSDALWALAGSDVRIPFNLLYLSAS
jgi:transcriptional activator SPT8